MRTEAAKGYGSLSANDGAGLVFCRIFLLQLKILAIIAVSGRPETKPAGKTGRAPLHGTRLWIICGL